MTALVMLAILLFGTVGYRAARGRAAQRGLPTIRSLRACPAQSETMACVATPLEKEFSTIAGVESMSSSNTQASTTVTLQFALDRNIDAAAQDVQAPSPKRRQLPRRCRGRLLSEGESFR